MKRLLSFFKRNFKRIAVVAVVTSAAVAIPLHSVSAVGALMEGSIGVANQTKGETTYKASTNAGYDDVVKFQVFYHNRELPTSGRVATNFKVKINMPTAAGTTQVVKVTMGGDNTNTITDTASVVLNRPDAHLEFISGSTYWRHNVGTRTNIHDVTQHIPDSTILNGTVLENVQPCHEFEATITFMARVRVPSVGVYKVVREAGDTSNHGVTQMNANAGDRLQYLLTAKNLGNTNLSNVILRDALPSQLTFVPGTVKLYNGPNPNGVTIDNAKLFDGGVDTGTVGPGAAVYITFEATVNSADKLVCGNNSIKNIDVVDTDQTGMYNNYAIVVVNKKCENQPTFTCNALTAEALSDRQYRFTTDTTALNGATVKSYSYDFGDGTDALLTDAKSVEHTYAKPGTYDADVAVTFSVNGQDQVVKSDLCQTTVTIKGNKKSHTPTPPTQLPNTGAGDVVGIFAATTVAGAVAHKFWSKRLTR